jgi:hypothetical protein
VPLPILLRKCLRQLSAPELRVLVYLLMRASQYSICYPTLDEMAHEVGLSGRKNLFPHLKSLQEKKYISVAQYGGKNFYLLHDPRVALKHAAKRGVLSEMDLQEVNDLCFDLKLRPIVGKENKAGKKKKNEAS